jgi:hypothetical protein
MCCYKLHANNGESISSREEILSSTGKNSFDLESMRGFLHDQDNIAEETYGSFRKRKLLSVSLGRNSVVSIATQYWLDGQGIESLWGRNFSHLSRLALRPPSLLYNGYRLSLPGIKRPGRGVDHPPLSNSEVKERIELYLYPPCGILWSVLRRFLPFFLLLSVTFHWTPFVYCLIAPKPKVKCMHNHDHIEYNTK